MSIEKRVKELIAAELAADIADVTMNADIRMDLDADSLDRIELVCMVEDEFGVEITDEQMDNVRSVGDLVRLAEAAKN